MLTILVVAFVVAQVPSLDAQGIDLLTQMMLYEPSRRISTKQALKHPYFSSLDRSLYATY